MGFGAQRHMVCHLFGLDACLNASKSSIRSIHIFLLCQFWCFFGGKHLLSKRPSVFFLPRWTNDVSSEAHVETMKQMRRENTRKLGLVSNIVSDGLVFTVIFHKNQRNVGIDIPYMDGMGYIFKHLSPCVWHFRCNVVMGATGLQPGVVNENIWPKQRSNTRHGSSPLGQQKLWVV